MVKVCSCGWILQCCFGITGNDDEEAPASLTEEGQAEPTGMREIHEQLETCTTSERADEIAINFCLIQTKSMLHSSVTPFGCICCGGTSLCCQHFSAGRRDSVTLKKSANPHPGS